MNVLKSQILTLAVLILMVVPAAADDFDKIVERYRELLLAQPPPIARNPKLLRDRSQVEDWQSRYSSQRTRMERWMAALSTNGSWPDIDYTNQDRAFWKTSQHLDRVRIMAWALADAKDPLYRNGKLEAAALRALDYWLAKRFQNPNWWWNRIGVPMAMRDVIVLLDDRLSAGERVSALDVLGQCGTPKPADGANTIWIADLALQRSALMRDAPLVEAASRLINGEIHISTGEGIQPDYSFHQHSTRLQQFSYGRSYLTVAARLAWQLNGTRWAVPREKVEHLADFVLRGCQWMCRGIYTVPPTLDRAVSRPDALAQADLRVPLRQLREVLPDRARELDEFLAQQNGRGQPLVGVRTFPRSDFAVYHRPSFSFFVKMLSDRTLPAEVGLNGENLTGALLDCGSYYLLRDGLEYFNLAPVWDWNLLPGVTYAEGAGTLQRQAVAGAISDGKSCAAAMDCCFGVTNKHFLTTKKFWACRGDIVVALIADLDAPDLQAPVRTAFDQCLLRGDVAISDGTGAPQILPEGDHENLVLKWVHHAGFAYAPLGGLKVSIRTGPVSGSWHSINSGLSAQRVTAAVFLAVLEHGSKPVAQNSGFVIAACSIPGAEKLFQNPSWHVLRNDSQTQAVRFDDGTLMAAFRQRGEIVSEGQSVVGVDRACLLLLQRNHISISDPTQSGGAVNVRVGGKSPRTIELPQNGETVESAL